MPEQIFFSNFKIEQKKRDFLEAKNCFQVGTESVIRSVKMSGINEAGALVTICGFQNETESVIKSVETSKINDSGASLMRCCSQIETGSEIELVEMSKTNDAGSS